MPQSYRDQDFALGSWVSTQRQLYKSGELADERKHRLLALPGWTWEPHEQSWDEGYQCLLRYVERTGNARVPIAHREDGFRLGQWVNVQRTYYEKRAPPERIARLNELQRMGWVWSHAEDVWETGFEHLVRWAAERVCSSTTERDGVWLRHWQMGKSPAYSACEQSTFSRSHTAFEGTPGLDQEWPRYQVGQGLLGAAAFY